MEYSEGSRYTAIAFKSNETAQYYALTSHLPDAGEGIGRDSTLRAKNFFIYRELSGRTTGNAKGTAPHVHFEVHNNGDVVDPSAYINGSINVNTGEITGIKCDELINE